MNTRIFRLSTLEVRVTPYPYEEGTFSVMRVDHSSEGIGVDRWLVSAENIQEQLDNILGHGFIEVTE